jgi:hypothetical protein
MTTKQKQVFKEWEGIYATVKSKYGGELGPSDLAKIATTILINGKSMAW